MVFHFGMSTAAKLDDGAYFRAMSLGSVLKMGSPRKARAVPPMALEGNSPHHNGTLIF